jgi:hypothetical protein
MNMFNNYNMFTIAKECSVKFLKKIIRDYF